MGLGASLRVVGGEQRGDRRINKAPAAWPLEKNA
jgi:hypothetical protein